MHTRKLFSSGLQNSSYQIIVKNRIKITRRNEGFKILTKPDPNIYDSIRYFDSGDEACEYILNLVYFG